MQNINMLQGLPTREKYYFTFKLFKRLMLIWFAILMILYFIIFGIHLVKSIKMDALKNDKSKMLHKIEEIAAKNTQNSKDRNLKANIQKIKTEIDEKKLILSFFKNRRKDQFSHYLLEISKVIPDNVWLNQITILLKTDKIFIRGYALDGNSAISFARQLDSNDLFDDYRLYLTDLRLNDQLGYYEFEINNAQDKSNEKKQ